MSAQMNGRSRPSQIWLEEAACQRMSQTEAFVFPSAAIHGNNLVKSLLSGGNELEIDGFTHVQIPAGGSSGIGSTSSL